MTLNWNATAADCRVAEYLAPLVLRQFDFKQVGWTGNWTVRADHTYDIVPGFRAARNLDHLLSDLSESFPEGGFWHRTRNRLFTPHGRYQIRRTLEQYLMSRDRGNGCLCPGQCRYPQDPNARA